MYEQIKKNIIENFFNGTYRYTTVSNRKTLIDDINKRLPFKTIPDQNCECINICLGDDIFINLIFSWETKTDGKMIKHKLIKIS